MKRTPPKPEKEADNLTSFPPVTLPPGKFASDEEAAIRFRGMKTW